MLLDFISGLSFFQDRNDRNEKTTEKQKKKKKKSSALVYRLVYPGMLKRWPLDLMKGNNKFVKHLEGIPFNSLKLH